MNRDNQNNNLIEDVSPTNNNTTNSASIERDPGDAVTNEQENLDDDPDNGEGTPLIEETQDENNPEKSTPESGAYLVCKGALCKCSEGALPFVKLQITSHSKYYVNDMQGAEKLVATVADNTFPTGGFGACRKKNNNPCNYIPQALWEIQAGEEHPVENINNEWKSRL